MGAEFHVQASDIVKGNEKLNLGFVAALFNACPGLLPPEEKVRYREASEPEHGLD